MATTQNLTMVKGDTKTINLTVSYDSGSFDLTGATVYLTVKERYPDTDEEAILQKIVTYHTNPTEGETIITIVPADTSAIEAKDYLYDIQVTDSSSNVFTVLRGDFCIIDEVTKS
jgi:hypothetical protein